MGINYNKKMAQLRYKDKIIRLHIYEKKSIREITKIINYSLMRTKLKVTLSKSTVATIIKEYKKDF